jgi:hypothetical protein
MMLNINGMNWGDTEMLQILRRKQPKYKPNRMYQGETAIERAEFGYPEKNVYRPDDVPVEE